MQLKAGKQLLLSLTSTYASLVQQLKKASTEKLILIQMTALFFGRYKYYSALSGAKYKLLLKNDLADVETKRQSAFSKWNSKNVQLQTFVESTQARSREANSLIGVEYSTYLEASGLFGLAQASKIFT